MKAADAVLVLTPEYNRSYPGVLKNALDWSSRPAGDSALAGKPGAVAGVSPGAIGTALAQVHLRSLLDFLGVPLLARSEVYIQYKDGYLTDDGQIADPRNAQFLTGWLAAFAAHIARYAE
ncbi:MAG: NAD(P)H-dependent oxidoreductase [Bifidobacteriaceae bacterium]|nr:NAD(P)H-dependent oxidoreductase [Bifidobacteriaceae bacterium]